MASSVSDPVSDSASLSDALLVSGLLFTVTFIGGVFPPVLNRCQARRKSFQRSKGAPFSHLFKLQSFSSGCLLTLLWIHLMPELIETAQKENNGETLLPGALVMTGFLIIAWLDLALDQLRHRSCVTNRRSSANGLSAPLIMTSSSDSSDDDTLEKLMPPIRTRPSSNKGRSGCLAAGCAAALPVTGALYAHALLEGVTLAAQATPSALWVLALSLCAHKWVVAMSLTAALTQKGVNGCLSILLLAVFAILSPLGLLLGKLVFQQQSVDGSAAELIVSALATGSLLYITLFELLLPSAKQAEVGGVRARLGLLLCLSAGAALMVGLQAVAGEE